MNNDWLKEQGYPDHVVEGGITRLVSNWSAFVQLLISGTEMDEYETLNDLDGRNIIDKYLTANQPMSYRNKMQLEEADRRFLAYVVKTDVCVWSEAEAEVNGWTPDHHWWYFYKLPTDS